MDKHAMEIENKMLKAYIQKLKQLTNHPCKCRICRKLRQFKIQGLNTEDN